jgi:predicted nuclease of predicted toxin-antitoxin system
MKVLLDECVDQRFRKELIGCDVVTVSEAGWSGKKNGQLLALAAEEYQVFITVDRNLYFQQNLRNLQIAVVILVAHTNRLADLQPLAASVLERLSDLKQGDICLIPNQSK